MNMLEKRFYDYIKLGHIIPPRIKLSLSRYKNFSKLNYVVAFIVGIGLLIFNGLNIKCSGNNISETVSEISNHEDNYLFNIEDNYPFTVEEYFPDFNHWVKVSSNLDNIYITTANSYKLLIFISIHPQCRSFTNYRDSIPIGNSFSNFRIPKGITVHNEIKALQKFCFLYQRDLSYYKDPEGKRTLVNDEMAQVFNALLVKMTSINLFV